MGGKQSKESTLDKLQDSRDAMKDRDEYHLSKAGGNTKLEYVPRQDSVSSTQNSNGKPATPSAAANNIPKRPSIQCSE